MRFLFMSEAGDGLGFAARVQQEGDEAYIWTKNKRFESDGSIIKAVKTLDEGLSKRPDCVIVDSVGMGRLADYALKKGFKVFGGGEVQDTLEDDRDFAMKLVEGAGIKVPPYMKFVAGAPGLKAAAKFVADTKKRYVFKPNGKADCSLTYVSKSHDDMISYLSFLGSTGALKGPFLLQEFVAGVELSTEVLFFKGKPIYPADATIELKKFMNGDLGPNTGCMASTVWTYESPEAKVLQATFKKLFKYLESVQYTGPLDINAIVNEKGVYFLEFTPRWGYSASYVWAHMLSGPIGKNLHGLATGAIKELNFRSPLAFGLRISIPPFPLDPYDKANWPAFDAVADHEVSDFDDDHTWLLDVKKKEGKIVTAGTDGVVCELVRKQHLTGDKDRTLQQVVDHVYEDAKKISISNKQYRTDGIERALKQLPELKLMGYEVPKYD